MINLLDLMICRIPGLKGKERIELQKKFYKEVYREFDRDFYNEDDFLLFSKRDIENLLGRVLDTPAWNMDEIRSLAEKDAELSRKLGMHMVSYREEAYPPLLREIFDPPALLFFRGMLPDPLKPLVAVVGTRKPSSAAAARAFALGRELGEAGIPVVSGLALGIDAMAHRGNIEGKAPTVAVLGSGLDQLYPSSNRALARRILEIGGAILSEYPPGTRPLKWNFPARNRIISALARGTVIVEAPEKSGALITAEFALEQNRDLWVDKVGLGSAGAARLVEDGAGIISSAREILVEWNLACPAALTTGEPGISGAVPACPAAGAGLAHSMAEYLDIKL